MFREEELVWSREWSIRMPGSGCQLVHCYGDAVMLLDHDVPRTRKMLSEAGEKPGGRAGNQQETWLGNQIDSSVPDLSVVRSLHHTHKGG